MRFLHLADVHLGASPDAGYEWAADRAGEIWDGFRRCIAAANDKRVDLLLIAGDLFDRQPTLSELREVDYLFSTLEKTLVVLIAGEKDCLTPSSLYRTYKWHKNVVCLFSTECEKVRFPQLKTEVYGLSYDRPVIPEAKYDILAAEKSDYFQILLAHGGDSRHIPISRDAIRESGFDYIALGHVHRPQVFIEGLALYSGALQPVDAKDTGPHGYVLGDVNKNRVNLSFVEHAGRQYLDEEVELSENDNADTVRGKIMSLIKIKGSGNIYRIRLTGTRSPSFVPDTGAYRDYGRILTVKDETSVVLHLEQLRRRYRGRLIGDFIESFGDGPRNPVEEKALRYGLEALLKQQNR